MSSDNIKELLTMFDTTRQHFENLIKILESPDQNDGHKLANQVFKIDLNLTEIQKRLDQLRRILT
jgi:Na+/phosphate symporter